MHVPRRHACTTLRGKANRVMARPPLPPTTIHGDTTLQCWQAPGRSTIRTTSSGLPMSGALFVEFRGRAVLAIDRQMAVIDLERHGAHGRGIETAALLGAVIAAEIPAPAFVPGSALRVDQLLAHFCIPLR